MNEKSIEKWKKIFAVITGLVLMCVSIYFSNMGFGFETKDDGLWFIGVILAVSITVIELVFNGQLQYNKQNFTIYTIGIFAYLYGVSTNISGFWSAQHVTVNSLSDLLNLRVAFGMLLGTFLEIAPEPLIVYGLIGISDVEGDFIGALVNTFGDDKPKKNYSNQNNTQNRQINNNNQQHQQNNNQNNNNQTNKNKQTSQYRPQESPVSKMRNMEREGTISPEYARQFSENQKYQERYRNES